MTQTTTQTGNETIPESDPPETGLSRVDPSNPPATMPAPVGDFDLLMDPAKFDHIQRVAKLYASASLTPTQYRGNVGDCIIALQMSMRLGVDPFMFLQNTYVVSGRPGMEAKLAIALVNQRGPFRGPILFEMERDADGNPTACTAYAYHKNGERCDSRVTWQMVVKEGWSKRNGSKWMTMPEQMFKYRSAVFLARTYCPEVLMGMQTADELEDVYRGTRYIQSRSNESGKAARLNQRLQNDPVDSVIDDDPEPAQDPPAPDATPEPDADAKPAEPADAKPDAKPKPTGKAAAPTAQEQIAITFAEAHGIGEDTASAALNDYCATAYGCDLEAVKLSKLPELQAAIKAGDVPVGASG